MAEVDITAAQLPGGLSWRISWSGSGTFYVYLDGFLYVTTTRTFYDIPVESGAVLAVQVFDSISDTPDRCYPSQFVFFWERSPTAKSYRIDEYVDSEWVVRHRIRDADQWMYHYRTRALEDEQSHRCRVVAIGPDGVEGAPKDFTIPLVRRPSRPDQTVTYDAETRMLTGA